jgi:creatinine amidohydrolase
MQAHRSTFETELVAESNWQEVEAALKADVTAILPIGAGAK